MPVDWMENSYPLGIVAGPIGGSSTEILTIDSARSIPGNYAGETLMSYRVYCPATPTEAAIDCGTIEVRNFFKNTADDLVCPSGTQPCDVMGKGQACSGAQAAGKCTGAIVAPLEKKCKTRMGISFKLDAAGYCVPATLVPTFLCLLGSPCDTAVGSIDTSNPLRVVEALLRLAMGIIGGVIIIMLIKACYLVMTSAGEAGKLKQAQEIVVAVLAGAFMVIFSVVLLRAIGVEILGIPSFFSSNTTDIRAP